MFDVGQLVVYGTTGVCRVADNNASAPIPGMGSDTRYYLLEQVYAKGTIYAPHEGSRISIRPVISREEALRLIDLIPTVKTAPPTNERSAVLVERYQQALGSSNCEELVCLLKTLYLKKKKQAEQRRKFGQVDERFLKRAQNLLHSELAAALEIAPDEVEAFINSRIGDVPDINR